MDLKPKLENIEAHYKRYAVAKTIGMKNLLIKVLKSVSVPGLAAIGGALTSFGTDNWFCN